MKNLIDISCLVVFGILIAAFDPDSGHAAPQRMPNALDQRVNDWLTDLRQGRSGSNHWLDPANAQQLPGVRSWETVESSSAGRIVRVEYRGVSGTPVDALWQISLDDGKIVSIHQR